MAAKGRKKRVHEEEHPDERWLLTYADMITLLMALFMVLFSISSVNTSKFESLQRALQDAFSGRIMPGGHSIAATGADAPSHQLNASPPDPSLRQNLGAKEGTSAAAAKEQADFEKLKQQVESAAAANGLSDKVKVTLDERGLSIRLLADDLLFESGSADLKPRAGPLMRRLAQLLQIESTPPHAVRVEGHTDAMPARGSRFPSNWELSTARASAVVRSFARNRVAPARMEAVGRAQLDPIGSNASAGGRADNRRVEILLPRREDAPADAGSTTPTFP